MIFGGTLKCARSLTLVLATVFLVGCAGTGFRDRLASLWPGYAEPSGERLVAEDFASMLKMLPGFAPSEEPLAMNRPESSFGTNLLVALRSTGYSVIFNDTPEQRRRVEHGLDDSDGSIRIYTVNVGSVSLGRDYEVQETGVFPISFMRVTGAPSDGISIDDSRFRRQDRDVTIITGISPDAELLEKQRTMETAQLPLYQDDGGDTLVDKNMISRENMYDTRKSNFKNYFAGFESVEKTILVFPNDSLRVLPEVRTTVKRMSETFHPDTDVFSVIGCSHGRTALDNGNELLAVGRSKRILEELIAFGVPDEKVLDEGCWANVHFDGKMPRKGVVLELKRRSRT